MHEKILCLAMLQRRAKVHARQGISAVIRSYILSYDRLPSYLRSLSRNCYSVDLKADVPDILQDAHLYMHDAKSY